MDPSLRFVRDRYLLPYVHPDGRAIEIGPGGGRWTRGLLGFGELLVYDLHQELLDELARQYRAPHLRLVLLHHSALVHLVRPSSARAGGSG